MKKNIAIGVLLVITILAGLYYTIAIGEAKKQTIRAAMNLKLARKNEQKAKSAAELAVKNAGMVRLLEHKSAKLEEQLLNCK